MLSSPFQKTLLKKINAGKELGCWISSKTISGIRRWILSMINQLICQRKLEKVTEALKDTFQESSYKELVRSRNQNILQIRDDVQQSP